MPDSMTPEQIAEIKARVEATPRGPWHVEYFGDEGYPQRVSNQQAILIASTHEGGPAGLRPIPEFLAHARQDIPALLAEVERLRAELGETEHNHHIVDFRENGWTVQHPLSCRPNLFDCKVNKAAERDLTEPPAELGRFVCELDGDGQFAIGARAKAGGGDTR
jgi:hypothetical protein